MHEITVLLKQPPNTALKTHLCKMIQFDLFSDALVENLNSMRKIYGTESYS